MSPTALVRTGDKGAWGDEGGDLAPASASGGLTTGAPVEGDVWTAVRPKTGRNQGSPPPCVRGWSGSRFWALAEACSDDDDEVACDAGVRAEQGQAVCSVSDFVARAEELGGSFKVGRRRAFAPGGHGPRRAAAAAHRLPRAAPAGEPGAIGLSSRTPACFSSLVWGRSGRSWLDSRRRRPRRACRLLCLGLERRRPPCQQA